MVVQRFEIDGVLITWKCAATLRERLLGAMDNIGLGAFVPPVRSVQASLRMALTELAEDLSAVRGRRAVKDQSSGEKFKQVYAVEPHIDPKVDGFQIVDVRRQKTDNRYDGLFSCKVVMRYGAECIECGWHRDGDHTSILQKRYDELRQEIDGSAIGASLVKLTQHFHGTCVRNDGGVYFVPAYAVGKWDDVVRAYNAANKVNQVTLWRVQLDSSSIEAVKRAIEKELIEEAGKVAEELRAGDLGEQAIQKRIQSASEMRKKCTMYESILSTELTNVRSMLTLAETAVSSGIAVQEGKDVFAGIM